MTRVSKVYGTIKSNLDKILPGVLLIIIPNFRDSDNTGSSGGGQLYSSRPC
ncbi:MAG: hypothetical protein ACTHKP_02740 [Nitrososphaeraceae archaeon]